VTRRGRLRALVADTDRSRKARLQARAAFGRRRPTALSQSLAALGNPAISILCGSTGRARDAVAGKAEAPAARPQRTRLITDASRGMRAKIRPRATHPPPGCASRLPDPVFGQIKQSRGSASSFCAHDRCARVGQRGNCTAHNLLKLAHGAAVRRLAVGPLVGPDQACGVKTKSRPPNPSSSLADVHPPP